MNRNDLRIVFMGTPEFAATCLHKLCESGYNVVMAIAQPDKPVGRKKVITPPPCKVAALELGIPVFQPDSMKSDEAFETISAVNPDLIITAAYGKILPKRVLDLPKYECINVHASLLPKYRGAAPVQYSILNGDEKTGVTIMKMDVGMDTGDMITAVEVPIDINIHTDDLMAELADKGSELLVSMIEDYVAGEFEPMKQKEEDVTLSPPILPDQGVFEWSFPVLKIHNMVRALSSWPGASTLVNGKKFKVYDSRICSEDEISAIDYLSDKDVASVTPGTVVKAHKKDLIVKCGDGFLKILELQSEGGKRLKAIDCAHNYKVGTELG